MIYMYAFTALYSHMVCDLHTSNAQKDSPFNVTGIHFSGSNLRKDDFHFFHSFIVFFIICPFFGDTASACSSKKVVLGIAK